MQATAAWMLLLAVLASTVAALPLDTLFAIQAGGQHVSFNSTPTSTSPAVLEINGKTYGPDYWAAEEGVGHFSEWSKATKYAFLRDWQNDKLDEWTLVMGNEGGDLDSMTAALTWAYHISHSTLHHDKPRKAVALLQTPLDALDLRPENKVALDNSKMSSGHRDLLTIDELPAHPSTLARKVQGIILVDHPVPLRAWDGARVLSIFDHHSDRGAAPDAKPRIFEHVASCTTLVARQLLDELEKLPAEYHLPHELLELILSAIAIDSDGLNPKKSVPVDVEVSRRVLARSNWHKEDLYDVMERLDAELGRAKKDLSHLSVRDLLRRDWKGDVVDTISPRTPSVHLGFASVPVSLDDQILRTNDKTTQSWFLTEAAWTAEIGADISIALNSYKVKEDGVKKKIREIVLVVRNDKRIDNKQADELFAQVSAAIEADTSLNVKPWHGVKDLARRQ